MKQTILYESDLVRLRDPKCHCELMRKVGRLCMGVKDRYSCDFLQFDRFHIESQIFLLLNKVGNKVFEYKKLGWPNL